MAVAADAVFLAAHDHRDLGVRLEAEDAVDDVAAGFLEAARHDDVVLLVEARLDLHEHRDLLAVAGSVGERRDDRRLARDAVERLLDGEYGIVIGGRADEVLDRRERLVRMVDEHVLLADGLPDVLRLARGKLDRRLRHEGLVAQRIVAAEVGERREEGAAERPVNRVDVELVELELLLERLARLLRARFGDLEAHGRALAPLLEGFLDFEQQVVDVLADVEVGVARDTERRRLEDLVAGEEALGEVAQDVLKVEVVLELRYLDEAAEDGYRHGQDGEADFPVLGALEVDGEVEALARQEGEGVRRVDAHRRDDGEDLALEEFRQPELLLGVEVCGLDEVDAVLFELGERRLEAAVDVVHLLVGDAADGVHLALRCQSADVVVLDAALDEVLESGDADHEELIEVGAADGDEA